MRATLFFHCSLLCSLLLLFPATATAQDCCDPTVTILDESFEGGLPAGWTAFSGAHVTSSCPRASNCDGSQWAYLGFDGACGIGFGFLGTLRTPSFSVPAGATAVRLTYCSAYQATQVDVSVAESTGLPLVVDVPSTSLDWQTRVVMLDTFTQRLDFTLISAGPGTSGLGWMIDHVRVEAVFDTGCPEIGTRYCTPATANSSGQPGRMAVKGSEVVADDDLVLTATQLPTSSNIGYFIMGTGTNTFTPPGSSGPICVAPGIQRFLPPVNNTNELPGGFCRTVGTSGPVSGSITSGSTWNFQAWHRDGMNPSNLTDAVSVTFL